MQGFLSRAERLALRQELRVEKHARYSDRIKCILLLDAGKPIEQICEYLFLSTGSVRNYKNRYLKGGLESLFSDDYQGSRCRLGESECRELEGHLKQRLYQTVREIRKHIKTTYSVKYSITGLRYLLKRMGFVYKKPKAVPGRADRKEQEGFLLLLEEKLSESPEKSALYYADGTHPQHNTHFSYGWIKRGEHKEIKTNTGRQRVNINGAVNAKFPTDVVIQEGDSVNAQSTVALFKKLERRNAELERIYVVTDNARYYRCRDVKQYLETSKIEIIFLPPYSPNLNLIERLWRLLKKIVLYNRYFEKFSDFRQAILTFFRRIKRYRHQLESLLTLNFHTVGA